MRVFVIITALALAWTGIATAAMLTGQIPTAAIRAGDIAELPSNVAVVDMRAGFLIVRSEDPSYVQKLYAAGASIVIPVRHQSCMDGA